MTADVLMYTTSWCPFCSRAKALLKEKGVQWTELDIEADPVHRQAMTEASGRTSVPQIFINGTLVGGSEELFALDVRGELDQLLGRTPSTT
ncbi:glutaredoxin 3 [Brevundimonas mediterranea]|uniref:glutaredoxin 3 n=1 Tax=Brevundimonas mediterranea TaxID=74329 RepID=UPI00403376A5